LESISDNVNIKSDYKKRSFYMIELLKLPGNSSLFNKLITYKCALFFKKNSWKWSW